MAAVNTEWTPLVFAYGDGHTAPWAQIEVYPNLPSHIERYHWCAKSAHDEMCSGYARTLEEAQRSAEDWMFPDAGRTE